jgi:hypothetical protein
MNCEEATKLMDAYLDGEFFRSESESNRGLDRSSQHFLPLGKIPHSIPIRTIWSSTIDDA